jgi:hypothetical protein
MARSHEKKRSRKRNDPGRGVVGFEKLRKRNDPGRGVVGFEKLRKKRSRRKKEETIPDAGSSDSRN